MYAQVVTKSQATWSFTTISATVCVQQELSFNISSANYATQSAKLVSTLLARPVNRATPGLLGLTWTVKTVLINATTDSSVIAKLVCAKAAPTHANNVVALLVRVHLAVKTPSKSFTTITCVLHHVRPAITFNSRQWTTFVFLAALIVSHVH